MRLEFGSFLYNLIVMKFLDEAKLEIYAGNGGNGIVSFRREAHVSKGGPDGGDGGNGGSIYFVGTPGINTLFSLKMMKIIRGNNGENGRSKNQFGAAGKDIFIKIPLGTVVYDKDKLICDVTEAKEYLIAKGGKGGRGNTKFKSSRNQAPKLSENGTKGEKFEAHLTLKVLADIGLVGKPSAGKSTILSKISNAKPKIAAYSFTTLNPQLGLVNNGNNSFVVADLPGLIKGAAIGKGLGFEFLKHIERCRVIAHIIDFGDPSKDPIMDFEQIKQELYKYKMGLENRQKIIVANKSDLDAFKKNLKKFKNKYPDLTIVEISAMKEKNIQLLKTKLYEAYKKSEELKYESKTQKEVTIELEDDVIIVKPYEGMFEVSGIAVERIYNKIPLNTFDNIQRFNKLIKNIGVWNQLIKAGIKNGDQVRIFDYELEWGNE